MIYSLEKIKRQLAYPYRLSEIGWMPDHRSDHRNNTLDKLFFCISLLKEKMPDRAIRTITFSMLPPGTFLDGPPGPLHDELFFSYLPETAEKLFELLKRRERFTCSVSMDQRIQCLIQTLRQNLDALYIAGTADRLDHLALELIGELSLQRSAAPSAGGGDIRLHGAAIELKKGVPLAAVLKKYAFSRRTFYRAWKAVFSVSPVQYLLNAKLDRASELLLSTDLEIKEIAAKSRFASPEYFCRSFTAKYGVAPRAYRQSERNRLFHRPLPDASPAAHRTE